MAETAMQGAELLDSGAYTKLTHSHSYCAAIWGKSGD